MRLRRLGLDRQASFGITSSVDDAKPGANTLESCSFAFEGSTGLRSGLSMPIKRGWIPLLLIEFPLI